MHIKTSELAKKSPVGISIDQMYPLDKQKVDVIVDSALYACFCYSSGQTSYSRESRVTGLIAGLRFIAPPQSKLLPGLPGAF